ncbi:hypothetical protein F5B17DRAFT_441317 [Nemania serpens]|nr:hypothetical protein F5B17DRAFT_441317 [Nemania serpens]
MPLSRIRLDRKESQLLINHTPIQVISIIRDLDFNLGRDLQRDIKLGIPNVPNTSREKHFETIRQWLRLCDDKNQHPHCQVPRITSNQMPTRLIDVGKDGDKGVHICELGKDDIYEYIALSHPWGSQPPFFISTCDNIDEHRKNIELDDLPATFRDAVVTTRAIGKGDLWIDSFCIIQGPRGDFQIEAEKMETVFSSAYCVLAASRAHHQREGFLEPRIERDYVTMRDRTGAQFYHAKILMQHALARRTIFFTEHQTYWECGDGVRCETLTKMTNNLAAFLGDPQFPHIILSASRGERIIRFQNLLSRSTNRLLKAFDTRGGYGVFDEDVKTGQLGILRRGLLWYRPESTGLLRIKFPAGTTTTPLDFGKVDWVTIQSPWSGEKTNLALKGHANTISEGFVDGVDGKLYFDDATRTRRDETRCVVLGIDKRGVDLSDKPHYFILVEPMSSSKQIGTSKNYERVGTGFLAGKHIRGEGDWISVY